jgi:hypothetical protein
VKVRGAADAATGHSRASPLSLSIAGKSLSMTGRGGYVAAERERNVTARRRLRWRRARLLTLKLDGGAKNLL